MIFIPAVVAILGVFYVAAPRFLQADPCPETAQGMPVDESFKRLAAAVQDYAGPLLSSQDVLKIEQISSAFENSTTEFRYSYIEDIGDKYGITAGRIGFTSTTGDLLETVQKYVDAKGPDTPLAKYLPCLKAINHPNASYACLFRSVSAKELNSKEFKTTGLLAHDFGRAWVAAASDPIMKKVQDEMVEKNVLAPALKWTNDLQLKSKLGVAIIYDSILQRGEDGPNGMEGMAARVKKAFAANHRGKTQPSGDEEEKEWLSLLLQNRRATLKRPYVSTWKQQPTDDPYVSYPRAECLMKVLKDGNLDFSRPVEFKYFGDDFSIR